MSEALEKARLYEAEHKKDADPERPRYHLTPMVGWMNDPNGFSMYKGEYHLFYQYYPYTTHWGPTHWGHVKTRDFITWEYLPCALAPEHEYEGNGCFSGSAIEMEDGRQLLLYTGGSKGVDEKGRENQDLQHQCAAIGDGIDYVKVDWNPIIPCQDIPAGGNWLDFRDPKVYKEDGVYKVLLANRPDDGSGRVLQYQSQDGLHWDFCGIVDECHNEYGKIWECPDLFLLDGKWVLLGSPQEMVNDGLEFHPGYGTLAIIGEYDKEAVKLTREHLHCIDYGTDFYAPQTLETPDGRRVMIAWMMNWTNCGYQLPDIHYFGSMTIPRELHVRDGRLCQWPVKELENYRKGCVSYSEIRIDKEVSFEGVKGRYVDLSVSIRSMEKDGVFRMKVARNERFDTVIEYRPSANIVTVDRINCGTRFDMVCRRDFYVRDRQGQMDLRIILDKDSYELYINEGEQTCTGMIYTDISAEDITFAAEGGAVADITCYEM